MDQSELSSKNIKTTTDNKENKIKF